MLYIVFQYLIAELISTMFRICQQWKIFVKRKLKNEIYYILYIVSQYLFSEIISTIALHMTTKQNVRHVTTLLILIIHKLHITNGLLHET